jgi:hypothetical protein
MRRRLLVAWVVAITGTFGCGGDGGSQAGKPDAGPGATADAPLGPDGATASAPDARGAGAPDARAAGAPDAVPCPLYQALCGGACIPTSVDPNNCGGCGVTCGAAEVCSSGACIAASGGCPPGTTPCGRTCVDLQTDDNHCGSCPKVCDTGTGCVEGICQHTTMGGTGTGACVGGGPPLGETNSTGATTCYGDLAQVTFPWALCSCTDINLSQALTTDAYDSTAGGYQPGEIGGGVGLDGHFHTSAIATIAGALFGSSRLGLSASELVTVAEELHLGGPFDASKKFTVGYDAFINGSVTTSSSFIIGGALHVPKDLTISDGVMSHGVVREPVTVAPPCDCTEAHKVPIAAIIASHVSDNDNKSIGLGAGALADVGSPTRLDLPCGRYYLTAIGGSHEITIVAHGRTALYVGGDVGGSAPVRITLDPTAELDIFIGGKVAPSQALAIGSASYPALTRLYIGGTGGFDISGSAILGAFFYAANGLVHTSQPLEVFGGVIAGNFDTSQTVGIHYDRAVLAAGRSCDTTRPPPSQCLTCQDCGNQACIDGACGACRTSADCCDPLVCVAGRCAIAQCGQSGTHCDASSPCCDGYVCDQPGGAACLAGEADCVCYRLIK